MTAPLVVIAYQDYPDTLVEQEVLRPIGAEVRQVIDVTTPEGRRVVAGADALMVALLPVTAELLAGMPRCRIISRVGTGIDAIDIGAATERGIWVSNVPDYAVDEVSTHTIALLLAQTRRLPVLLTSTRSGQWDYSIARPIRRLAGQQLGLVGFGRIAQAVARKATALGLTVLAHDPYISDETITAHGVRPVDLDTLLSESDWISLHVPLLDATHHIINSQALARMKPTAFVINTARGGLIDIDALLHTVREGRIAGAALDVLPTEPPGSDHPILHEPNILVTPHSAWYSEEAAVDMRVRAAEAMLHVLRGETPRTRVNQVDPARFSIDGRNGQGRTVMLTNSGA